MIHVSTERVATPRTATDRRTRQLAKEQSYPQNQKSLASSMVTSQKTSLFSVQSTDRAQTRSASAFFCTFTSSYFLVVRLSGYALASERQKNHVSRRDGPSAL